MLEKKTILDRLDIPGFYLDEVPGLKIRGNRGTGLCPFHEDHDPSLSISLETGRFICFACGEKGDLFRFYMARHGCDFRTALEALAQKTGVAIPDRRMTKTQRQEARAEHQAKVQERKRRRDLVRAFRAWEVRHSNELGRKIQAAYAWIRENVNAAKDLHGRKGDTLSELYLKLHTWERDLEILACGSDREKYELYEAVNG